MSGLEVDARTYGMPPRTEANRDGDAPTAPSRCGRSLVAARYPHVPTPAVHPAFAPDECLIPGGAAHHRKSVDCAEDGLYHLDLCHLDLCHLDLCHLGLHHLGRYRSGRYRSGHEVPCRLRPGRTQPLRRAPRALARFSNARTSSPLTD